MSAVLLRSRAEGLLKQILLNSCRYRGLRTQQIAPSAVSSTEKADEDEPVDKAQQYTLLANCGKSQIFVCWHPQKPFPYEHTKPIERSEAELRQANSPLHAALHSQYHPHFYPKGPNVHQLGAMFHTPKHEFEKRTRRARIDSVSQKPPINRKGL